MQFPQDGGLSCVRYYLASRDDALNQFAHAQMQSAGVHVGRLICQCSADNYWDAYEFLDGPLVILSCGCNGSSLPVYIGKPPFENGRTVEPEPSYAEPRAKQCRCGKEWCNSISIGIGYPGPVPPLGTVDVERAQEVLIAAECKECGNTEVKWHLRLPAPPMIVGDEPWIRSIQGLGYGSKTRWP